MYTRRHPAISVEPDSLEGRKMEARNYGKMEEVAYALEHSMLKHLTELKGGKLEVKQEWKGDDLKLTITHPRSYIQLECSIGNDLDIWTTCHYNYDDERDDDVDDDDAEWLSADMIKDLAKATELKLGESYLMDGEEIAGVIKDWRK